MARRSPSPLLVLLLLLGTPVLAAQYEDALEKYQAKDFDGAIPILREGLALTPEDYNLNYLLALSYQGLGRWGEAIPPLQTASGVRPDQADPWGLLGWAYLKQERSPGTPPAWSSIAEAFSRAAQLAPDRWDYQHYWGQALFAQRKRIEALDPLKRAVALAPAKFVSQYYLGLALYRERRHAEAIDAFQRALELEPDHVETMAYLGECLVAVKRYAQAEKLARDLVARAPDDHGSQRLLGRALFYQGSFSEAIQALRVAVRLDPDAAEVWFILGQCHEGLQTLRKGRDYSQAVAAYDKAIGLKPGRASYHYKRGRAYERWSVATGQEDSSPAATAAIGYAEKAIQDYDRTLELDPKHDRALQQKAFARELKAKLGLVP